VSDQKSVGSFSKDEDERAVQAVRVFCRSIFTALILVMAAITIATIFAICHAR